jgi:hypothetical protein
MPGHGRTHGTGGEEPEAPRRRHVHAEGGHSVRANEDAVEALATSGRAGNRPPPTTEPAGTPGGRPTGRPTRIGSKQDASVQRSLDRENTAAETLADQGFRVQQNPSKAEVAQARLNSGDTGSSESDPDYLVEGRVFDCYSPSASKPVRGIWSEVEEKVLDKGQTQRVVINLADWPGDLTALGRQFENWPIPGLKEAKAITPNGDIVQLNLHSDND